MAKWISWVEGAVKEEGEKHYGEGPFMVTSETDDDYYLLVPFKMKREWFKSVPCDERTERHYASLLTVIGGHRCSGGGCKGKKEDHPLAGLQTSADPKHVEKSPFTKQFYVGQPVRTPQGPGVVSEVRWRLVGVGKVLYDYWHVQPEND